LQSAIESTVTRMKVFLDTCILTITFISQCYWGKHFIVETNNEDDVFIEGVIKINYDEDITDGKTIIRRNLKGDNLKKFDKLPKDQQEEAGARIKKRILDTQEKKDYGLTHQAGPNVFHHFPNLKSPNVKTPYLPHNPQEININIHGGDVFFVTFPGVKSPF